MTVELFLANLNRMGIEVRAHGGKLQINSSSGALKPELLEELRDRKQELLAFLDGPADLSYPQERLWLLHQFAGESAAYHLTIGIDLRGSLGVSLMEQAVQQLVRRHESLRTVFRTFGSRVKQVVLETNPPGLATLDVSGDSDAVRNTRMREVASQPFDFEAGPMFRATLFKMAPEHHVLLLAMPHIVSDGWSVGLLTRELGLILGRLMRGESPVLSPVESVYRDFSRWQRARIEGQGLDALLKFWRGRIDGAPTVLNLPTDKPRPSGFSFEGGRHAVLLPASLVEALQALAKSGNATLFMTLLSGFTILLSRYAGQDDLLVGVPVANRTRPDFEGVVGCFINTLVIRANLSGNPTVLGHLAQIREMCLDAFANQDLPFEKLVEHLKPERDPSRNPLFQALFAWDNDPPSAVEFEQLTMTPLSIDLAVAQVDLSIHLRPAPDGLLAVFQYASDLFYPELIEKMAAHFLVLLGSMGSSPVARVEELPMMGEEERGELMLAARGVQVAYPDPARLHTFVERQAARTPHGVALRFEGVDLSYETLNSRANQLARSLRDLGVKPGHLVGVLAERSQELVVSLLAVLKAGGAYVPLEPGYPKERLGQMLEDAETSLVLAQPHLEDLLPPLRGEILLLDPSWMPYQGQSKEDLVDLGSPDDLAYVIFTSGSTGRPKGAMNSHRAICNRLWWMQGEYRLTPDDRVLQKTPAGFDVSVWEFFWPLMTGSALVIARPEGHKDPLYLHGLIAEERITTVHFVPSMLRLFLDEAPAHSPRDLRRVLCSGEALGKDLVERFFSKLPGVELHNLYGPTEAAVDVTFWRCLPGEDRRSVPLGRPVANTRIHILDKHWQLVPAGVPGELCIGGAPVGGGYVNQPGQTAEKFVPDPFSTLPGSRLYRTGDLARHFRDGAIEYLGRLDSQVKIGGQRIELMEIESKLLQHPAVGQSVVVASGNEGFKRLVAYVSPRQPGQPSVNAQDLKRFLARFLPPHMVPSMVVVLEHFPLTSSGKLDRKALPGPDVEAGRQGEQAAPRTAVEAALAALWAEALKLERVGIHDNFFELGGHSLLAISVLSRMRQAGVRADLKTFFATPTIAAMAVDEGAEGSEVPAPPNVIPDGCQALHPDLLPLVSLTSDDIAKIVDRVDGGAANIQDIYPLAPLQEGLLFHHVLSQRGDFYLLRRLYLFESRARMDRYVDALQKVVDRHDVLRTAFLWEGLVEPVQVVLRHAPLSAEQVSMASAERDVLARLKALYDPVSYRLDVRAPPLIRLFYAWDGSRDRWVLLQLLHHLAMDHATLDAITEEVGAILAGEEERLPAPLPFRNFVSRARRRISAQEHEAFFRGMLEGVTEPTVPFGFRGVEANQAELDEARLSLGELLSSRLRGRSRALGVSTASLFHLAWAHVLARTSGRSDVVFGTLLFGKKEGEAEGGAMLGLFINTLPVRMQVGRDSAEGSARQAQQLLARLIRHEHAPLALAQGCSSVQAPTPLLTSLLNYRHSITREAAARSRSAEAWRGIEPLGGEERTHYPLYIAVDDFGEEFALTVQARPPLNARQVGALFERILEELVEALEKAPASRLQCLDGLRDGERRRLIVEWNQTARVYPPEKCVQTLFEEQAARTPDAVAVEFESDSLTYQQLNSRANQLALELRARGVRIESSVGLCVERSSDMVVAMLAVLKAGGAYVPLDPSYPAERLGRMVESSKIELIVTQRILEQKLCFDRVGKLFLETCSWQAGSGNWREDRDPGQLAYVMFTSGSTGQPKGVEISHRSLVNCLLHFKESFEIGGSDVWLAITTLSFDIAGLEIWLPLISGARCILARRETAMDGKLLRAVLEKREVTILQATPVIWRMLLHCGWKGSPRLQILCGGESLSQELANELATLGSRAWNLYGPTETTIWSTASRLLPQQPVTIGTPIANTTVYVLDNQFRPVPAEVVGDLYIGGDGVARGYASAPELTAERFIPNPFDPVGSSRLYKTGDRAKWEARGELAVLGRADFQVKLRGFRIELEDVESELRALEGVEDAAAVVQAGPGSEDQLQAYVTLEPRRASVELALRESISRKLPAHMVPSAFFVVPSLPRTPNGKLDRRALGSLERTPVASIVAHVAPRNETERSLVGIWQSVLRKERVGVRDNFFELGGHSMLALQVFSKIEQSFGKRFPLALLFRAPTVEAIAAELLKTDCPGALNSLVAIKPQGRKHPIFLVHGVGGNVIGFHPLARLLASDQPVYGLQSPGLDGSRTTPKSIEAMAEIYTREIIDAFPTGPYHLAGMSFGGVVAYEMAQQFLMMGRQVGLLALFDSYPRGESELIPLTERTRKTLDAWRRRFEGHLRDIRQLSASEWPSYLGRKARTIRRRLNSRVWQLAYLWWPGTRPDMDRVFNDVRESNFLASRNYVSKPYNGRVSVFIADDHLHSNKQYMRVVWDRIALGGVDFHEVPGDHVTLIQEPHVRVLAQKLQMCLDAFEEVHSKQGRPEAVIK